MIFSSYFVRWSQPYSILCRSIWGNSLLLTGVLMLILRGLVCAVPVLVSDAWAEEREEAMRASVSVTLPIFYYVWQFVLSLLSPIWELELGLAIVDGEWTCVIIWDRLAASLKSLVRKRVLRSCFSLDHQPDWDHKSAANIFLSSSFSKGKTRASPNMVLSSFLLVYPWC